MCLLQNSSAVGVLYVCDEKSSCKSVFSICSKTVQRSNFSDAASVRSDAGAVSKDTFENRDIFSTSAKSWRIDASFLRYEIKFENTSMSFLELFYIQKMSES